MQKKWTDKLPYLTENVGKKNLQQMATELKVDKEELRLFLHRSRRFKVHNKDNIIIRLITAKFTYPEYFSPTELFYDATGIRQRRWWQLYKGEKKATEIEFKAVCQHLQIPAKTAMDIRQLDIFENV